MWQPVYRYFILHKKLNIPGIGSFNVETSAARLDFANRLLHAPLPVIRFTPGQQSVERSFFDYLAASFSISTTEAVKQYNDYCYHLLQRAETQGSLHLPGIGTLRKEFEKTFSFQPENGVDLYFTDLPAERVIRREQPHAITVGETETTTTEMQERLDEPPKRDNWWVYAAALALLAVAAIIYYHSRY